MQAWIFRPQPLLGLEHANCVQSHPQEQYSPLLPCLSIRDSRSLQYGLMPASETGISFSLVYMSHSTKMKEFGRKKSKKITKLILILFHLKLNPKHLTTIIHSFRQENSNNNNFRFILMAAHVKNVIPVTTPMNLIS